MGSTIDWPTGKAQSTSTVPTTVPAVVGTKGLYTDYYIEIQYIVFQHRLMLPVASSSATTPVFAYLAAPTSKKVVRWTAEAAGQQPSIPAPWTTDPNEVLLNHYVSPVAPDLAASSQTVTYRVSGEYHYGVIDMTKVTMSGGAMPWLQKQFKDGAIKGFVSGIIDQGSGAALKGFVTT